jgi:hypothetical protein
MATRPVFKPLSVFPFVEEIPVEFKWYPGFAKSQAQKSLQSLHSAAKQLGISSILEISSRSTDPLGISLSAFNLKITPQNGPGMSVECAFQGSKVFKHGGPFHDLYTVSSIEAKKDPRIRNSGDLVAFNFLGESFPITPVTAFYDWLYMTALFQNPELSKELLRFEAFTGITSTTCLYTSSTVGCDLSFDSISIISRRCGVSFSPLSRRLAAIFSTERICAPPFRFRSLRCNHYKYKQFSVNTNVPGTLPDRELRMRRPQEIYSS